MSVGLDMSPFRRGGASTLSGLWTPLSGSDGQDPGQRYTRTFVTYSELGGGPVDQRWITSRLEKMSAYDCLQMLGRLSCMIDAAPLGDLQQQLRIMGRLNWPETVKQAAAALLTDGNGGTRSMFFPQQVVHLARLAVLHADPRPPDDFAHGALANDFVQCVLAVTELLGEDLRLDREEQVVSFILRQTAINHRPDSVALWTRYYDIFACTWDEVATAEAFDAAAAFEHHTGISLQRWLMVGFAIYTQFLSYGSFLSENYLIVPRDFFANTPVEQVEWDAVLAQTAVTLDEARTEIIAEEARLGPTFYRCQAFEQRPLLQMPGEAEPLVPFAVDSFERHMTEGIFWVLSDAAMAEGKPREHFTGAFGQVFEEWVQQTFERAIPTVGVKRVHRARPYRSHQGNVDSTDVVLDYEPEAVFIEVVSKRQQNRDANARRLYGVLKRPRGRCTQEGQAARPQHHRLPLRHARARHNGYSLYHHDLPGDPGDRGFPVDATDATNHRQGNRSRRPADRSPAGRLAGRRGARSDRGADGTGSDPRRANAAMEGRVGICRTALRELHRSHAGAALKGDPTVSLPRRTLERAHEQHPPRTISPRRPAGHCSAWRQSACHVSSSQPMRVTPPGCVVGLLGAWLLPRRLRRADRCVSDID
jgi:hypothetical protein